MHFTRENETTCETLRESTAEEVQIQIHVPKSLSPKSIRTSKENVVPKNLKKITNARNEPLPDFDGGCWEMLNQDAVQILPPKPKFPTKPTTSCIKPTFKDKEKKGMSVSYSNVLLNFKQNLGGNLNSYVL